VVAVTGNRFGSAAALFIALGLGICIRPAEAGTSAVRVSGATLSIPDAPGLVAVKNIDSPYYRFMSGLQTNAGNELLADYLPSQDAKAVDAGRMPSPARWAIVYSMGALAGRTVTQREFEREFVPSVEESLRKALRDPQFQRRLDEGADKGLEQLGKDYNVQVGRLRVGQLQPFGIYARKPNYLTYGAGTRVHVESPDGKATDAPLVMALGFVLAKQRLFCIAVYRVYHDPKDAEMTRSDAADWAEAILRANP